MNTCTYLKNMKACIGVETPNTKKHLKRCSKSSVIKWSENGDNSMYHFIPNCSCPKLERWVMSSVDGEGRIQEPSWTLGWSVRGDSHCGKQTATYIPRTQKFCSLRKRHKHLSVYRATHESALCGIIYSGNGGGGRVGRSLTVLSGEETVNCEGCTRGVPSNHQKPRTQWAQGNNDGP